MTDWRNESTRELCRAIVSLDSEEECLALLEDLCTVKEILDMAQRLSVAKLLARGTSYVEIAKETGASTATISRVSKCYEYGSGGYRTVIDRCESKK